ncbi:MAG: glycosyltransferase [Thermoflexales bacterium]|nr:glycosyltransferase [Thermoflexales bacterium]
MKPRLSLVIPAFNEAGNLERGALDTVEAYLAAQPYDSEVIVVDDGSADSTAALIEAYVHAHARFRLIRNPHRGKAYAVSTGMLAAQGEIVLFSDMDQATPLSEVELVLPWFERGYDVVIGSRGTYRRNAPFWRLVMSRGQMILRNIILGFSEITDTQCGFKAFRGSAVGPILDHLHFYKNSEAHETVGAKVTAGFDVELLFVAKRLGYKVREVPVAWDYQHSRRVNLVRDSLRGVMELGQIRLADLRGAYRRD